MGNGPPHGPGVRFVGSLLRALGVGRGLRLASAGRDQQGRASAEHDDRGQRDQRDARAGLGEALAVAVPVVGGGLHLGVRAVVLAVEGDDVIGLALGLGLGLGAGLVVRGAVTERGRKHILELAAMSRQGIHTGVLFLVHWDRARWFLPDYHTDPAFAQAFYEAAPHLDWKALALHWDGSFSRPGVAGVLTYPQSILERENHDSGDYLFILHLADAKDIAIGSNYVYTGSARKNLAARLARHSRKRKKMHWHIDYLRQEADVVAALPVRTADDLEHDLARAVDAVADWRIEGFGCTDCDCPSHLFGFAENPIHYRPFIQVVEDFRMNRLASLMTVTGAFVKKD